ncbi:hypothetical protein J8J40_24565, partial [Mycobacterium tuberculosis]|nr:hypothetical protein [Mycobacterium tuberculosis]
LLDLDFAISVYQDTLLEAEGERAHLFEAAFSSFSEAVGAQLGDVDRNGQEMKDAAASLAASSQSASNQAIAAAANSEETATTVQTVAAATEELTASVSEIARQLATASGVVQR